MCLSVAGSIRSGGLISCVYLQIKADLPRRGFDPPLRSQYLCPHHLIRSPVPRQGGMSFLLFLKRGVGLLHFEEFLLRV